MGRATGTEAGAKQNSVMRHESGVKGLRRVGARFWRRAVPRQRNPPASGFTPPPRYRGAWYGTSRESTQTFEKPALDSLPSDPYHACRGWSGTFRCLRRLMCDLRIFWSGFGLSREFDVCVAVVRPAAAFFPESP